MVLFMSFGASTLDFSLRAWTYDFDRWIGIRSDMLARMYDALRDAGIQIPFPQRDLHLRSVSEEAGRALHAAWPANPHGPGPARTGSRDGGQPSGA